MFGLPPPGRMRLPLLDGTSFLQEEYVQCKSCNVEHIASDVWFCKECYDKFSKATEGIKQKMVDLEAKRSFLPSWIGTDHDRSSGHFIGLGFADVLLVVKEGPEGVPSMQVPAHWFILASRSEVLKKMFENEMEESRTGKVHISDASHDAIQEFVKYLYTVEVCLEEQMAWDLLRLAERDQVLHLKANCESFMVSRLNWENSISYYIFAHQHRAAVLLKAAKSLLVDNVVQLHEHPNFSELVKVQQLLEEIYVTHFRNKKIAPAPEDAF